MSSQPIRGQYSVPGVGGPLGKKSPANLTPNHIYIGYIEPNIWKNTKKCTKIPPKHHHQKSTPGYYTASYSSGFKKVWFIGAILYPLAGNGTAKIYPSKKKGPFLNEVPGL